jgi:hypothetical protein
MVGVPEDVGDFGLAREAAVEQDHDLSVPQVEHGQEVVVHDVAEDFALRSLDGEGVGHLDEPALDTVRPVRPRR